MFRLRFLTAIFLAAAPLLFAQKSDCSKAVSTADQADCANRQLQSAEAAMKDAFEKALEAYTPNSPVQKEWNGPALPKSEEEDQEKWEIRMRQRLRESQETWIRYRESACATVREMYDGGTFVEVAVPLCKADLTELRTKFLRDYFLDQK